MICSDRYVLFTAYKKNVHFRPGIIHFFLAREVDVLFFASYFYSKHTLMGERR